MESQLFLIQEGPRPDGPKQVVLDAKTTINVRDFEHDGVRYVPVFSSVLRIQEWISDEVGYVGLRHDGIFRLEAGRHFRRDRRTLQVTRDIDKNGYERELPLTNRAYESLAVQGVDIGPIFQRWDYRKSVRTAAKALGLDPDDLKSLDVHAATDDGARKSGHLGGLAYMAGHTDKHTTSRYIHPQIDDAREVLNKRFPSNGTPNGTPNGTRTNGSEGSQ